MLTDDTGADWFLALWMRIPTPDWAVKIHKSTIDRLLKTYRIRGVDTDKAIPILRQ